MIYFFALQRNVAKEFIID